MSEGRPGGVVQGVIETIDAAIQYRGQLCQLVDSLNEAKNQVCIEMSYFCLPHC